MKVILGFISLLIIILLCMVIKTLCIQKKVAVYAPEINEERTKEYLKKFQKLIQYETISYRNQPDIEKFRGFHEVLAKQFPTVFEKLEKIEIDGNLMMKWKGTDSQLKPIMVISHQDVVSAEGEWSHGPFSGDVVEDRIYGRGTADIKCGLFSFYQATEELLKEGYTPKCDIYLGSSCTEEIGGDGAPKMVQWLKNHNIRLFMLSDEGGCIVQDPIAGVTGSFAAVGIFEKGYGDLKFTARSNGGHSSTPPKNTPIVRLAKFEAAIEKKTPFAVKFSPAVDRMFKELAPYCNNFWLKMVMANLPILKPLVKKILPVISPEAAAMLQTTIAFTMQKGSDGYNLIPQEAWVTGNLRYIPHQGLHESNEVIKKMAQKYDIETEEILCTPPSNALDFNSEAYRMTEDCIHSVFPGLGIMPYVVTGGTDSRFFNDIAENAVRFSPVMVDADQLGRMHGIDENIFFKVLPPAVDYFKHLFKEQERR